jgi:hypothetical protein
MKREDIFRLVFCASGCLEFHVRVLVFR